MAKADRAIPQKKTRILECSNFAFSFSGFVFRVLNKESVVCERAAKMESRLEMAAAKIPAKINPRRPTGSSVTIQTG